MSDFVPARPTGSSPEARFAQSAWDRVHGAGAGVHSSATVKVNRTTKGMSFHVARPKTQQFSVNAHPFQLYKLQPDQIQPVDRNDPAKVCYAVRSGYVEMRPRWILVTGPAFGVTAPGDFSFYWEAFGGGGLGDDVQQVSPAGALGFAGNYFVCDPTPEISASLNYGSYYAFYIQITDATPNALPVIQVLMRRFSPNNGGITYPAQAFPVPTPDVEIIQVAILQLSPDVEVGALLYPNLGVGAIAPDGLGAGFISQILRDNLVNRFDRLGMRLQGIFGFFDPSEHRVYYPGDLVYFEPTGGAPTSSLGYYLAMAIGANPAGTVVPTDNTGAEFVYFSNPTQPP